jgi:glycosyltransferase involved in cell wall biosynthesis
MHLVIDAQALQTASRNRGIGRYTRSLVRAMIANGNQHRVTLVLNGMLPDAIDEIRADFASLLPSDGIQVWTATGPVHCLDRANELRRKVAEHVREAFIQSLKPDIVLISSLFEGERDDATSTIGLVPNRALIATVLYDLIPWLNPDLYLTNPDVKAWYLRKLDNLRRSDLLLSISGSAGQEAIDYLGVPEHQIINISSACDDHFRPRFVESEVTFRLRTTFGIVRPFVLSASAIEPRKNIEGLIRAFAALPTALRRQYQLVVVGYVEPHDRERLLDLIRSQELARDDLVMTGFVTDDDLVNLYNLCELFIFPSLHEGFGLPALEAMACGRAVIGSNRSSIPEVIGRQDALFDPRDVVSMSSLMVKALSDVVWRQSLEADAIERAARFSWDNTARKAWHAIERLFEKRKPALETLTLSPQRRRPRLAYISPLPPEPCGISEYSAELLPELSRHYEIEVIVAQESISDDWVQANCLVRDVAWFRAHAKRYDRVLYHFGDSAFHGYMFDLLAEHPGVVVLHDFFLSGISSHMDVTGSKPQFWAQALYKSHGYRAVVRRYTAQEEADVISGYPCSLGIFQQSLGVIVHSPYSVRLAETWYGAPAAALSAVVPLMRVPLHNLDRTTARRHLGLEDEDFVVCSFGRITPTKLNHRLLNAWLASSLPQRRRCRLVFIGQNDGGGYEQALLQSIRAGAGDIQITGSVDVSGYRTWLAAADVCVQLGTISQGEFALAVLDCMNAGVATIVNAHGSMADLPQDAVWMLPGEFTEEELIAALVTLYEQPQRRARLGAYAKNYIRTQHRPRQCAKLYAQAIETFYAYEARPELKLLDALSDEISAAVPSASAEAADALSRSFAPQPRRRQLLVDVSELCQHDAKSGIQRVVREVLRMWLDHPPPGWSVEPVYAATDFEGYRYARRFTCRFLGIPDVWAQDEPVEAWGGDVFLGLDLLPHALPSRATWLNSLRLQGVHVIIVVYDLLPVTSPQYFIEGIRQQFPPWLETLAQFDGAVCISKAVALELHDWLQTFGPHRTLPFGIGWFHLGANPVAQASDSEDLPHLARSVLTALSRHPSFLMVSTIEPRKGYSQVLDAFECLWSSGLELNLVIVGKQGWLVDELVVRMRKHPRSMQNLFWLEAVSDDFLEKIYAASTCLIAASNGEGFGLPLIEAARHQLPIIARDIPVFREVAGEHAYYFNAKDANGLAAAIRQWLSLYRAGKHPASNDMPWLTWKQSSDQLMDLVLKRAWPITWLPDDTVRFWGGDHRLLTQVGQRSGPDMETTGQEGFLIYGPYYKLGPGSYTLRVTGAAQLMTADEWVDLTCDQGSRRLLHLQLHRELISAAGAWSLEASFVLDDTVNDLECRLWVGARTQLKVSRIEIQPRL